MQDLLFLSQRIPFPPNKGDKIRSFHILQDLCRHYRVHLGCFIDDPVDWQYLPMIAQLVTSHQVLALSPRLARLRAAPAMLTGEALGIRYFRDGRMQRWVTAIQQRVKPAASYIFSSQMAQYVLNAEEPGRLVMDFVDVDSEKWRQYAAISSWPMSALYRREGRALLSFERRAADLADASVFVSEPERRLFCCLAPEAARHSYAIGNGTDFQYYSPDLYFPAPFDPRIPTLVFTGAMDYRPNIDAVRWFVDEVLPIVRQSEPSLRLVIVGLNPTDAVTALARSDLVTVTGRVPDVRPYLAHAHAVIAPLLTARGIQNKILEAMSMARPVVATSQAFEGITAEAQIHLLVADGASAFAAATLRALRDPRSQAMGMAARRQICRQYGWDKHLMRLRQLVGGQPAAALIQAERSAAAGPGAT